MLSKTDQTDQCTTYLYVVHFGRPLSHAQHYIGATSKLLSRLKLHASGNGAKIIAACKDQGIPWTLATAFQATTTTNAFRLEKKAKSQRNGPRYCPICSKNRPTINKAYELPSRTIAEINKELEQWKTRTNHSR